MENESNAEVNLEKRVVYMTDERSVKKVVNLNLDLISYENALYKIVALAKDKIAGYVCFANVHMTIEAYEKEEFSKQLSRSSLILTDGMPLIFALRLLYNQTQDRIAGMDAFPDLLAAASEAQLKVFFFGTTDEILTKIGQRAKEEYPGLEIVGLFSPPFDRPINDPEYIDVIINSKANLVFVALGCPKQEIWMAQNSYKINAILLGVGGAFPVYAGMAKRAPIFMQKIGMEWLFRLLQEPKRLFVRYLRTNSMFLYLILKEKLFDRRRK